MLNSYKVIYLTAVAKKDSFDKWIILSFETLNVFLH